MGDSMTQGNIDINQILNELFREQDPQRPLSAQELEAWESGELSESQKQEMQRRLVMDKKSVRQLLEKNQTAKSSTPTTEESMASWQQFEQKLATMEKEQKEPQSFDDKEIVPFPEAKLAPVKPPLFYRFSALAASILLVIVIPQSIRFSSVSQQLVDQKLPSLDGTIKTVYLGDKSTRNSGSSSEDTDEKITFSNQELSLRMVLAPNWEDQSPWHVTIFDSSGNQVFHGQKDAVDRVIDFILERPFFSPGVYKVEVKGSRGESPHKGIFEIEI